MNKSSRRLVMMAGVIIVLTSALYTCGGGGGGGYGGGGGNPPPPASTVQVVTCPANGTTDVSIVSQFVGFSPSNIAVSLNTIVKWTNNDTILHTVTSTTVPANGTFNNNVNPGTSVCLKFTSAGTFNYHCSIHPMTMIGVVTVQ